MVNSDRRTECSRPLIWIYTVSIQTAEWGLGWLKPDPQNNLSLLAIQNKFQPVLQLATLDFWTLRNKLVSK